MRVALMIALWISVITNIILAASLHQTRQLVVAEVEEHRKTMEQNKLYREEVDRIFADYTTKTDKVIAGYQKLLVEQVERQNRVRPRD